MADQKLTELTDAGRIALGDTGDVVYIVTNAGNSRQAKLGALKTLAAADTGRMISNVPADVLAEATDTGVLYKLAFGAKAITASDTGDFFIVLDASDAESPKQIHSKYVSPIGQQTIWVPAGSMTADTTNGPAWVNDELANNWTVGAWAFDGAADEYVSFLIRMPEGWDAGTLVFQPYVKRVGATGGTNVQFDLYGYALDHDEDMDITFSSANSSTIVLGGTNGDLSEGPESTALTVQSTPAAGGMVAFKLARGAVSDNNTDDQYFIGLMIHYTIDTANDN